MKFQPDILLAHGSSALKYGAVSRLFYRKGLAVYRNIGLASFWARGRLRVWANRLCLRAFDATVSLSSRTREDFVHLYRVPPSKVWAIPNGVDPTPFERVRDASVRQGYRRCLGIEEDQVALISVGKLSPEKDQGQLLEVVARARGQGIPAKLLLVGEGPLKEEIQGGIARMGLEGQALMLGLRDDVPSLMAAADLFLLSSKTESMPAVLIEAGLAGLASVAYNVGAVADVVKDGRTGILVPQGQLGLFVQAALSLMKDARRRHALGAAAREHCQEHFDLRKVASMYGALFLRLLASKNGVKGGQTEESALAH